MASDLKSQNVVQTIETAESAVPTISEKPVEKPWQTLKAHPKVVLYAVCANIGPLMFGYDLVIVGAISALPQFRKDFGDVFRGIAILPALWLGLWNGLVQVGCATGSFVSGWFLDRFGRRATFFLGGLFGVIGTAMSYSSGMPSGMTERRTLFLLAKIVIGFGCGVLMSACQTYISEIAPKNLRGILLGFYAFNVSFGHLIAVAIVFAQLTVPNSTSYQIPFASQWAFGAVAMIVCFCIPESPVWLVAKRRNADAAKAVQRLGTADADNMLHKIEATVAHENDMLSKSDAAPTYMECFQGINWRRTRIIILLNILQQFVGISLLSNGAYFLIMAGMDTRFSLMVNLIGIASNMVANIISWDTVPRFGRRRMILFSIILDCVAWIVMGIAGCFTTQTAKWMVGVSLLIFGFFNSLGVASAVPVISSEISSVRLRSKSAGIGLVAQSGGAWVFSFFTPYLYNTDQANWGGKIGFFFVGLSVIAYVIIWLEVPETKGRTFAELDYLFETKTKARMFSKTAVPEYRDAGNTVGSGSEKF